MAAGEYILLLNADDSYVDDAVEILVKAQEYSGCTIVSALAEYVDNNMNHAEFMRSRPMDEAVYLRMPLRHETMLIPASLYRQTAKYDTSYGIISDWKFTIEIFRQHITHYEVPKYLLKFRNTGTSCVQQEKLIVERKRLLAENFSFLDDDELACVADIIKLTPQIILKLITKYASHNIFIKALHSLIFDRARWNSRFAAMLPQLIELNKKISRPKISVILPFYRSEKFIRRAVDSVLNQTLEDFELICIDDYGGDSSQNIVEEYCQRDSRVRLIKNDSNIGLGASRNAGVRASMGEYIFHLDSDDTIPPRALETLFQKAVSSGSAIVKGAYERILPDGKRSQVSLLTNSAPVVDVTLDSFPDLLSVTEGHWSCLYHAALARSVRYPEDLCMGQDSDFLVRAFCKAKSITIIPDVIYHYYVNPHSAMNTFTPRKYFDALKWRWRTLKILQDFGHHQIGAKLITSYWGEVFFRRIPFVFSQDDAFPLFERIREILKSLQQEGDSPKPPSIFVSALLSKILEGDYIVVWSMLTSSLKKTPLVGKNVFSPEDILQIFTFCSTDRGGGGIGSLRRINALRRWGLSVHLYTLWAQSKEKFVHTLPAISESCKLIGTSLNWRTLREHVVPQGHSAREFFSLAYSMVDFKKALSLFDRADILHFHWIVGMFDYANAKLISDKPVVWTLADMNAFTGGCHYSEGCRGFEQECQDCPMLASNKSLIHKSWKIKHEAYSQLQNLHIICPSKWLAEEAEKSSLLKGRPIHVIPNAFPTDTFKITNKYVARRKLGLPMKKKLLLFGADNVKNTRKGGEWLRKTLSEQRLKTKFGQHSEIIYFGASDLSLPIASRKLGSITSEERLALVYSAADGFLFPSFEDNAPLTVGESLLCGTPVVAFPIGNIPDLIQHRKTGYIARYQDCQDFIDGIFWLLDTDTSTQLRRSLDCRITAASVHDPMLAAKRHVELYRSILGL